MFGKALALAGLAGLAWGKMKYMGIAIPGIDFGCDIDGSWANGSMLIPLTEFGGGDGAGQMKHFVEDDKFNIFRIPVPWQFLGTPGSKLDSGQFDKYDKIIQACLSTGAYCMIDIHNFAHYDGPIIGQGGPTNDDFADLWSQLATHYADEDTVVFELMNEPHDLDINLWAETCQAAIDAIRKAGAKDQLILLPGTNFASAETVSTDGSGDAMLALKNPDGTNDNLLLDVHKYLDINNSGTHAECTTNNTVAFENLAAYLRKAGRKAIVSETGASSDPSCMTNFLAQNEVIFANSDVLVGFVAWGAGSFQTDYVLSLTPTDNDGTWSDNDLLKDCILEPWGGSKDVSTSSATTSAAASKTSTATKAKATSTGGSTSVSTPASTPVTTAAALDTSTESNSASSHESSAAGRPLEVRAGVLGMLAACVLFAVCSV